MQGSSGWVLRPAAEADLSDIWLQGALAWGVDQAERYAEQPRRMHVQGPTAPLPVLLWQGELWMRFGDMPRLLTEQTRGHRWSHWLPGRRSS